MAARRRWTSRRSGRKWHARMPHARIPRRMLARMRAPTERTFAGVRISWPSIALSSLCALTAAAIFSSRFFMRNMGSEYFLCASASSLRDTAKATSSSSTAAPPTVHPTMMPMGSASFWNAHPPAPSSREPSAQTHTPSPLRRATSTHVQMRFPASKRSRKLQSRERTESGTASVRRKGSEPNTRKETCARKIEQRTRNQRLWGGVMVGAGASGVCAGTGEGGVGWQVHPLRVYRPSGAFPGREGRAQQRRRCSCAGRHTRGVGGGGGGVGRSVSATNKQKMCGPAERSETERSGSAPVECVGEAAEGPRLAGHLPRRPRRPRHAAGGGGGCGVGRRAPGEALEGHEHVRV